MNPSMRLKLANSSRLNSFSSFEVALTSEVAYETSLSNEITVSVLSIWTSTFYSWYFSSFALWYFHSQILKRVSIYFHNESHSLSICLRVFSIRSLFPSTILFWCESLAFAVFKDWISFLKNLLSTSSLFSQDLVISFCCRSCII